MSSVPQRILPYDPFLLPEAGAVASLPWLEVDVVRDFGADNTGVLDSWDAIQRAINVVGPHRVLIPRGTYLVTEELTIDQDRVHILGEGQQTSSINFVPSSGGKAALHFKRATAAVLSQCSARGFTVFSTETSLQKFAVKLTDVSLFTLEDYAVYPFTGGAAIAPFTGGSSAGLLIKGREQLTIRNVTISADIPIWIADNPNHTIDIDHAHFSDLYLTPGGTNYSIYINTGVNLTNVTIDGRECEPTGSGMLYWVDTTSAFSSHNLVIRNVRFEQAATRAYPIRIEHNIALYDLLIENCVWGQGLTCDGIKLRKVDRVLITNYAYNGTGVAIDCDATVPSVKLQNCFAQDNSTVSRTGLSVVDARVKISSLSPIYRFELWQATAGSNFAAGRAGYFMGELMWAGQGSLTSGGLSSSTSTQVPSLGGAVNHGVVYVRFKGATKWGSFTVYFDNLRAKLESPPSADYDQGNVPGKITVFWQTAANIVLWNQLGETVSYSIRVVQS